MKKSTVILMSLLLAMALLCGCGKKNTGAEESARNEQSRDSPTEYASVLYITINPELALYLDKDNKVIAAEYLNDDAKEIFSDIQLKDLSVETAMEMVIETAVNRDFLTEGKTVQVNVEQADNEQISTAALIEKVQTVIVKQLEEKKVDADVTLSIEGESYTAESEKESTQDAAVQQTTPVTETPTEPPKEKCEACGGTGICPECGGGTYACKRCGGATVLVCSFCDGSGNMPCGCGGKLITTNGDGEPIPEDGWRPCDKCGGDGWQTCEHCGGGGKTNCFCKGTAHEGHIGEDCILCHGGKNCTACNGTGEK